MAYRPAGFSDDSDSGDEAVIQSSLRYPNVQHAGLLNDRSTPIPGPSTNHPGMSHQKPLNAKQRRSKKHWNELKDLKSQEINLGPIVDPKTSLEAEKYSQLARQTNLKLRIEIETRKASSPEHRQKIMLWTPSPWMLEETVFSNVKGIATDQFSVKIIGSYMGLPIYFIDEHPSFDAMMTDITDQRAITFDLECNMSHSFLGMTALMQIGTKNAAYLIDPFKTFTFIQDKLGPVLQNSEVLKIAHGMSNNYKQLQKDFNIYAAAMLDMQMLYNTIRKDPKNDLISLENLAKIYLASFTEVARHTLTDWRRRPLTSGMALYAACDVIVLLKICPNMYRLAGERCILNAFENTKDIMMTSFVGKTYPTAFKDMMQMKYSPKLQKSLDKFELLHQWRERYAAVIDDIPVSVASNTSLMMLSEFNEPITIEALKEIPLPPSTLRMQGKTILQILNTDGRDLLKRINNCKCHNCCLYGHAALFCPYPSNKRRDKDWGKDDPEYRRRQNQRRRQNKARNKQQNKTIVHH